MRLFAEIPDLTESFEIASQTGGLNAAIFPLLRTEGAGLSIGARIASEFALWARESSRATVLHCPVWRGSLEWSQTWRSRDNEPLSRQAYEVAASQHQQSGTILQIPSFDKQLDGEIVRPCPCRSIPHQESVYRIDLSPALFLKNCIPHFRKSGSTPWSPPVEPFKPFPKPLKRGGAKVPESPLVLGAGA